MSKQIIIIGGGVSGLTLLHYLKKRFTDSDVKVLLLEKEPHAGGKIESVVQDGFLFEKGPNGFLDNKESTLRLTRELGLDNDLIPANKEASERYILSGSRLHRAPMSPLSFFQFGALSLADKLRVPFEFFIPKGKNPDESVYEFGRRRLGVGFTNIFLDPMVSGIFAGDVKNLCLREAFPRIYELEQTYGSLFKAMIAISRERRRQKKANPTGQPSGTLWSLKRGMGQLTETLAAKYQSAIRTAEAVSEIKAVADGYIVETSHAKYMADHLFLATPADTASMLVKGVNSNLAAALAHINYAPVAVVGLGYERASLPELPRGFGYLIPSAEKRNALGVLLSSNIFSHRTSEGGVVIQVMLGGASHPEILSKTKEELAGLAKRELMEILRIQSEPKTVFVTLVRKAIPQYDLDYPRLKDTILHELKNQPRLSLAANYLGGIAMNDCTAQAEKAAAALRL